MLVLKAINGTILLNNHQFICIGQSVKIVSLPSLVKKKEVKIVPIYYKLHLHRANLG